jgi:hypothetical protein
MKLVKQAEDRWECRLNQAEALCLRSLLDQFPVTTGRPAKISRTDDDPQTVERNRLLDESLAEHRKKLKQKAGDLAGDDRFEVQGQDWRLNLSSEERETLLQILNDIRVGSWQALGEPEDLELPMSFTNEKERRLHHFMNLAGYFEQSLLIHELGGDEEFADC